MRLEWNEKNGRLEALRTENGENWIADTTPEPFSIPGVASVPSLERMERESRGGIEKVVLRWSLGDLGIIEEFLVQEDVVSRRISLVNRGDHTLKLEGVRLLVGRLAHGDPSATFFSAPGNNVRPRVPVSALPEAPRARHTRFAPSAQYRWDQPFEPSPDMSPGLLALHDPEAAESIFVWYWSEVENAVAGISVEKGAVSLYHDLSLAAWLEPGQSVSGGTQYLMLHGGTWTDALQAYRGRLTAQGLIPLYGPEPPEWVRNAAIFETHPGLFGGFRGLEKEIPRLAATGFNVLYLMPIWEYDNHKGIPWDGNWTGTGSPYAIKDFEMLDPTLGTPQDFGRLVETAHEFGMKVLVDFVSQGCARDSRYVEEHPDWFERDENGNFFSSHGWNDTYSFDWANPFFQEYMLGWSLAFLRDFDIDGFRVDAPHGKEPNWDRGLYRRHASTANLGVLRLLEWLQVEMKRIKKEAALLCEASGPVFVKSHDFAYDYPASAQFFSFLDGQLSADELCAWLEEHALTLPEGATRVCFTETHDTRTNRPPSYALRGSDAEKALLAAMVMAGFRPMVWSGQEKTDPDFYRALFDLLQREKSLRGGIVSCGDVEIVDGAGGARRPPVLAFVREGWIGVVSFLPEKRTFRFRFPPSLRVDEGTSYRFLDLVTGKQWSEYGKNEWLGNELLEGIWLTPEPFHPYFWRLERV